MLGINVDNLLKSLEVMGYGMIGIFVVTAIIILVVVALNKLTEKKNKNDNDQDK